MDVPEEASKNGNVTIYDATPLSLHPRLWAPCWQLERKPAHRRYGSAIPGVGSGTGKNHEDSYD